MPTYEFLCRKCSAAFEFTCTISEYDRMKKEGIKCEKCGGTEVTQQISAFQVKTSKKS